MHYLVAKGGTIDGFSAEQLTMLTVLGKRERNNVVINELTTVGSVWPNAQLWKAQCWKGTKAP